MSGGRVLITGATSGIGFQLALDYRAPAGRCGVAGAMASGCWRWGATASRHCNLTGAMQAR